MPDYEFKGVLNYKLTRDDELNPLEEPIECVMDVLGYPFKITGNMPFTDGPVSIQVIQNGERWQPEPDSDGFIVWRKVEE